jgi:hypothetical protein
MIRQGYPSPINAGYDSPIDTPGGGGGSAPSRWLLEDETFFWLLEDGTSKWLLES